MYVHFERDRVTGLVAFICSHSSVAHSLRNTGYSIHNLFSVKSSLSLHHSFVYDINVYTYTHIYIKSWLVDYDFPFCLSILSNFSIKYYNASFHKKMSLGLKDDKENCFTMEIGPFPQIFASLLY